MSGTSEPKALATNVQAFPNPFAERVSIGFELKNTANIKLNIYDMSGRLVMGFAEQKMAAGAQSITWQAADVQPGMYIYHLLVGGRVVSGLITLNR